MVCIKTKSSQLDGVTLLAAQIRRCEVSNTSHVWYGCTTGVSEYKHKTGYL